MCIYISKNEHVKCDEKLVTRYLQYLFYPPYTVILIILFDDFSTQMDHWEDEKFNKNIGIRLRVCVIRFSFACSLITIEQLKNSCSPNLFFANFSDLFWKLLRLVFWFLLLDFLLHFINIYSLYSSHPVIFHAINNYESM